MRVSIIIPAYNEEHAVKSVVDETKRLKIKNSEIIVVDDGSTDKTYDIIRKIGGVRVFKHSKNMGKGVALKTGLDGSKGDIIVTIDADNTYPVKSVPELVKNIESGYDLAIGSRFLGTIKNMPAIRRLGNILFSSMISIATGKRVTDASSGMRAFRKVVLKRIAIESRNLSWEVEMTTKALKKGFAVAEIPIEYSERTGRSKLNVLKDGISFLSAIVRGLV